MGGPVGVIIRDFAYKTEDPRHAGPALEVTGAPAKPKEEEDDEPVEVVKVQAQFDFDTEVPGELSFKTNDVIVITESRGDGWLRGTLNGVSGFVPESYVKQIEAATTKSE